MIAIQDKGKLRSIRNSAFLILLWTGSKSLKTVKVYQNFVNKEKKNVKTRLLLETNEP